MVAMRVLEARAERRESSSLSSRTKVFFARFVYRLGRCPFKAERRVRFSYRVPIIHRRVAASLLLNDWPPQRPGTCILGLHRLDTSSQEH